MTRRRRLGDILIERGVLTQEQLDKALERQRETKKPLGAVLVELEYLRADSIADILAEQLRIPRASWTEKTRDPELALLVPMELLQQGHVFPLSRQDKTLVLAMVDPLDIFTMDAVSRATGLRVVPAVATEAEIKAAYDRVFNLASVAQTVVSEIEEEPEEEEDEPSASTSEAPGVKVVQLILAQAVRDRASDIHIEPRESNVVVRFRVDGVLRQEMTLPKKLQRDIATRIKVMANMDITERRRPQDGRMRVTLLEKREVDMRISSLPTIYGEKIVIRLLDKSVALFSLDEIGFLPQSLRLIRRMLSYPQGLLLVAGPTGSGKTSTQYAFLNELNAPERNIVTVEDPVEYRVEGLNQVEVNSRIGVSFASCLRAVLRQDPEVLMVGEVRDLETAEIAVRAALTGHLVLSTLHTNSAAGTVTRLIDMGVEPFMVAATLLGVVSQRLVRRICPDCRTEERVSDPAQLAFLKSRGIAERSLWRGRGCSACKGSGYRGRLPIEEVLVVNRRLRAALVERPTADRLTQIAVEDGFRPLEAVALEKVLAGETTLEELWRTVYSVDVSTDLTYEEFDEVADDNDDSEDLKEHVVSA